MSKRAIERWKRLKSTGVGDGVIEVPSIDSTISTGFGTARYAIGEQGQPRLLIPVGGGTPLRELTSTPNLVVTTSSFIISGKRVLFLDILCQDRALDLVFAELAEEILRRIKEGHTPLDSVIASIDDFRELLREGTCDEILDSKIQGLVGELEVMRHLTHYSLNAVDSWTGPFELRHDFRRGIYALEVKTSARSDATTVSIHGIDQLAPPFGGLLYLAHVRLERVESGSLSVSKIFNSLISKGVNAASLKKGLAAVECYDPHSPEWNRLTFNPEGLTFYAVVDGFPRVIGPSFLNGSIPLGVTMLEYKVDLNYAKSFELSTTNCEIALKRIAG